MDNKIKLKGNESFSIREGWLTKGIFEIEDNPKLFSEKEVTSILGIGTNMVKSLKYWLLTTEIIEEGKKGEYILTEFGKIIKQYDPYMQDIFTLFFIHINLVKNTDKAYIWNLFFNRFAFQEYTKKDILEHMKNVLESENLEYNEKMLSDDIAVLLKTYVNDEREQTPEDNYTCPLSDLLLVQKISKDKFLKQKAKINKLDKYVVYYCIAQQMQEKDSISIDKLIKDNNSVCKLLNLDKVLLDEYLEMLKNEKVITLNRTAGLNMVYLNKTISIEEIFEMHFGKEQRK